MCLTPATHLSVQPGPAHTGPAARTTEASPSYATNTYAQVRVPTLLDSLLLLLLLLFLLPLLLLLLLTRRTLVVRVGAGRRTKKEIPGT